MIEFRPLAVHDLALLSEWLNRPHVAEWWDGATSLAAVRAKYLPRISAGSVRPYIALQHGRPIGFIQSYRAIECGDGWWLDERDPGVMGIDQCLGEADSLGRGLRIQADPSPRNTRAIRCYENAGFRRVGLVDTPEGPALLMVIDTEGRDAATAS